MITDLIFALGNATFMVNTGVLLADTNTHVSHGVSVGNGVTLVIFTIMYASLDLPLAAVTCGFSAIFWALIFTYRGKESGAHEDSDSEGNSAGQIGSE